MRKIITAILLLSLTVSAVYAVGLNDSRKQECIDAVTLLKNHDIIEEKFITRRDCLVYIMKIVGVTDDLEITTLPAKYFIDCNDSDVIYFSNAISEGIAEGAEKSDEYEYAWKFKPDRCATYIEALTFITRCLKDNPINIKEEAVETGILKETDSFYDNLNEYITDDDFYILLGRMLEKKCYVYVGRDIDNPKDKTYAQILNERREKGITAYGYTIVDSVHNGRMAGELYDDLSIIYE